VALIDIHDIGQIGTVFGIIAILITTFFQIRSYKKDQKEQQERNRQAITSEINSKADQLLKEVQLKLDTIILSTKIERDDLESLKKELEKLKGYVDKMDREGTTEWSKVKPFIVEKIDYLEDRIDEIERKMLK